MKTDLFFNKVKRSVLLGDGGMGTMVQHLAKHPVRCVEAININNPEIIQEIHRQYIQAGSNIIETNTFGANRMILEKYDFADKLEEINKLAVRIAKKEAGADIFVAESIGPVLPTLEPLLGDNADALKSLIIEQGRLLIDEGVDLIILETFGSLEHLLLSLKAIKSICDVPIITSLTTTPTCTTYDGIDIYPAAKKLASAGADVIGLNCGHGIEPIERALKKICSMEIPISVMPNAGIPERVGARMIYGISEDYFAEKALKFAQLGARIIGGCCGITPRDIASAAKILKKEKIVRRTIVKKDVISFEVEKMFKEGAFLDSLKETKLLIICEIDPPANLDISRNLEAIIAVKEAGAHAVSMADNPLAHTKIENLAFACTVKNKTDISIILHITGRDRNLLGLESFMMGAHILGIEGLLMVTGDPSHIKGGPSNVFDVDSIGLIRLGVNLNRGKKMWGKETGIATNFSIGVAVNPNIQDYSIQIKKLKRKIDVGARFTMTQPMFTKEKITDFLDQTEELDIHIFVGIFPITSSRTAEYLHNEVPGIMIPDSFRETLARYPNKKDQFKAGIEYTKELLSEITLISKGIYLIAPHTSPRSLCDIILYIKKTLNYE